MRLTCGLAAEVSTASAGLSSPATGLGATPLTGLDQAADAFARVETKNRKTSDSSSPKTEMKPKYWRPDRSIPTTGSPEKTKPRGRGGFGRDVQVAPPSVELY